MIFLYGSHNKGCFVIGCVLIEPSRQKIERSMRLKFPASNNKDYDEATVFALRAISTLRAIEIQLFIDFMANKYSVSFEARED